MKKIVYSMLLISGLLIANEGEFVRKKPKLMETQKEEIKELPDSLKSLENKKNDFKYKESDFKKDSNFNKNDYSNMQKKEYKEADFDYLKPNEDLKKKQDQSFKNIKNYFGEDYANKEKMRQDSFSGGGD